MNGHEIYHILNEVRFNGQNQLITRIMALNGLSDTSCDIMVSLEVCFLK